MNAGLETRYRQALALYPRSWREANADAVVDTLLEVAAAEGRDRVRASEVLYLLANGLGRRGAPVGRPLPRDARDRAAALSLGTGTALSIFMIVYAEVGEVRSWRADFGVTFGPFTSPAVILYALWVCGCIAALVGLRRASSVIIAATIPTAIVSRVVADHLQMWGRPSYTTLGFLCILAAITCMGRATRSAGVTAIVAIAAVAAFGVFLVGQYLPGGGLVIDYLRPSNYGVVAGGLAIALGVAITARWTGHWHWSTAILIASIPWAALWAFGHRDVSQILYTAAGLALVIAVMAALLRLLDIEVTVRVRGHSPAKTNSR